MSTTFDFIVLGGHGAGLKAFHTFANMISGIDCFDWKIPVDNLKDCLTHNTENKKGIIIDREDIEKKGKLNFLLRNLSSQTLLICLMRDPCTRLKSVVNTHIHWWAESVAGTYNLPLSSNRLFLCGDELTLLKFIITNPIINPVVKLFHEFSTKCHKIHFYDISNLFPENAPGTFQQIAEILLGRPLKNFSVPGCLPFSRENLFVKFITPLTLGNNLQFKPCPVEFLPLYGYAQSDIVASFDPEEYGFPLGDFPGDVALVPMAPGHFSAGALASDAIDLKRASIEEYIDEVSRRHKFAKKLSETLLLTDEKLVEFSATDAQLAAQLSEFILSQEELVLHEAPEQLEHWKVSKNIFEALKCLPREPRTRQNS